MDSAIHHIDWGARLSHNTPFTYGCTAGTSMDAIRSLVKHGARWIPDDRAELNTARRSLYWVDKSYTVELITLFARYGSCDKDQLWRFVSSPKMIERLVLLDVEHLVEKQWLKDRVVRNSKDAGIRAEQSEDKVRQLEQSQ